MGLSRILIANRGEIAVRIARTARAMGIETVAVYSEADADALHVAVCDAAVAIGPAPVSDSYLRAERILEAAAAARADAVHPGYGFLSENADFAEAVAAAGLTWIGPPPAAIRAMGLKDSAKRLMEAAGVPVTPGYHGAEQNGDFLAERATEIGYPVLIKASAGGGGKGMRRVDDPADFAEALERARSEAHAAFGNAHVLVEKFILNPRHIEVQVFADAHGNTVHLYERDCSAQRRHQKVIEEAPAPGMTPRLRAAMTQAALRAAEAVGYRGAGTVEFIVDGARMGEDAFFFMEMNTRLQVEHPVTEAVTGLDLVEWQIRVARGETLPRRQEEITLTGHAVETRLYAEDPARDFLPQTGRLDRLSLPEGPDLRVDMGVREGDAVTPFYDPMIAKVIARGPDRAAAFKTLRVGLAASHVAGLATNLEFLERLTTEPGMASGDVDTGLIGRALPALTRPAAGGAADLALAAAALLDLLAPGALTHWRAWGEGRSHAVVLHAGQAFPLALARDPGAGTLSAETPLGAVTLRARPVGGPVWQIRTGEALRRLCLHRDPGGVTLARDGLRLRYALEDPLKRDEVAGEIAGHVTAPLPGIVKAIRVGRGAEVAEGVVLAVIEAMKMEHALRAPRTGRIAAVEAAVGDSVAEGAVILRMEEA